MVEYTLVNLITLLVGIGFLVTGRHLVKEGREDIALFVMTTVVGAGLMLVALVPNIFEFVAAILGLELKARAILVVSNLTLFALITYLFTRISTLHDRVSKLNEELSLLRSARDERNE